MIEQVLQLARPLVEQAQAYELVDELTPVTFEANRLKSVQTKRSHRLALTVVKNGRLGLANTTDFRDLAALVSQAVATSEFGAQASFELPVYAQTAGVATYDAATEELSPEAMIDLGQRMIDKVHNYDADILCSARLSRRVRKVAMTNTRGERISYSKTVYAVSLEGNLTTGTDILDIGEDAVSCRADMNTERLVSDLVEKFDMARREARVSTGELPVIFTPKGVASSIFLPLELAFNGKVVWQGASPLGDKKGEIVFDPSVSIYDDGTVDFAPRSADVDDEGVVTQRTTLVENGRVEGFIYDLQTAGLAGQRSTGNGFRAIDSLPSPTFTSVIFAEGSATLPEMIADIKEGLLIDQVMGAWAGNLLAGELSGNVHLGFKIENGRLVGRVKDTMIAGNVYEALGRGLAMLGCGGVWVDGALFTPPMYFKGLNVATKQG